MPKKGEAAAKADKTAGIQHDADAKSPAKKKAAKKGQEKVAQDVLTGAEFMKDAKPIKVTINGNEFSAAPKEFASKSYGWGLAGKVLKVDVGGKELAVQVTLNMPVRGSKPGKADDDDEEEK